MKRSLIARFMGPTWGPSEADRTQVGPMLAPWILLSGQWYKHIKHILNNMINQNTFWKNYPVVWTLKTLKHQVNKLSVVISYPSHVTTLTPRMMARWWHKDILLQTFGEIILQHHEHLTHWGWDNVAFSRRHFRMHIPQDHHTWDQFLKECSWT